MALHFAAAEPRIRAVAAFAPVTNLLALREFASLKDDAATKALDIRSQADKLVGRRIWVCIGNQDDRVNTDEVIACTRRLVAATASKSKLAPIELHVMPSAGHTIHAKAHREAAAWILANPPVRLP
jgi:dienelactone hydrolase